MRNRLSSHLFVLLALVGVEIVGYIAIRRSALIRGYETSLIGAIRDLMIYLPLIVMALWLSIGRKFKGNWTLYTTAIVLFSIGLLAQYRLYSDPEYNAKNKAVARQEKTDTLRMRYINESYDATKRQMMGLAAAIVYSSAGKALGNTTPWEPAKVPFLLGFAGLLTARYKDLARTYWGIPRARDIIPLLVMAIIPFIPFFALKDFGQMLIFS